VNGYGELLTKFMETGDVITALPLDENDASIYIYDEELKSFPVKGLAEKMADKLPKIIECGGKEYFIEKWCHKPNLILAGGGHVSLAVARVAEFLGFAVTVIDDRREFVNKERFGTAATLICQPLGEGLKSVGCFNGYYVIVTRGHKGDEESLAAILEKNAAHISYVGMIGSKTKVALTKKSLLEKGFSEAELNKVHAPIGLKIGAVTPEEIAISIMAEIIAVKAENASGENQTEIVEGLRKGGRLALITVVEKKGSIPRGAGSKMLLLENGRTIGSVGGGKVEYLALEEANKILKTGGRSVKSYAMDNVSAGAIGMACGGKARILLEGFFL
jgi:xanthine dehydrogenase accessory factor